MTMKSTLRWKFIAAVFAFALSCRLLPWVLSAAGVPTDPQQTWYPWNFSPLAAACVFWGAVIPQRGRTMLLVALLMIGGDLLIEFITGFRWWSPRNQFVQLWVYGSVLMISYLGRQIKSRPGLSAGVPTAILGEGLYFLITNFAVWLSGAIPGNEPPMYTMTAAGLSTCYFFALPYFGRSLLSTAIYAGLFFSPWGLSLAGVTPRRLDVAPVYEAARG
jgi:hypothetical protein